MLEFHNIVMLGAGNVATHLAKAFYDKGKRIIQVYSRTEISAAKLANGLNCGFTNDLNQVKPDADLYIISVSDEAVKSIVRNLKIKNQPVVHTSGSLPLEILEDISEDFGVFYPLQTFSKSKMVEFQEIPVCLEANSPGLMNRLKILAEEVSDHVFEVDSERRKILHVAAVFSCNFTNYMYIIGQQLIEQVDLDFTMLRPLIKETAEKVMFSDPMQSQTGPAIRGDQAVIGSHLELLKEMHQLREIYRIMSAEIEKLRPQQDSN